LDHLFRHTEHLHRYLPFHLVEGPDGSHREEETATPADTNVLPVDRDRGNVEGKRRYVEERQMWVEISQISTDISLEIVGVREGVGELGAGGCRR